MEPETVFRYADRNDVPLILGFVKELADYEQLQDEVVADEKTLEEWIFDRQKAEVIFALEDGKEVGYALFFHNFSTFLGRAGIYLEDLYIQPAYRGRGHGKALLKKLASIAVERGCGRLEWSCLDWNKPSIDFYLSLGAASPLPKIRSAISGLMSTPPCIYEPVYAFRGEKFREISNRDPR